VPIVEEGARFRAERDFDVLVMITWHAPSTDGASRVFPAGEEFLIMHEPPDLATAASCVPVRYDDIHGRFVDPATQAKSGYAGYHLVVDLGSIEKWCRRVA
jgi:hypothetical protein